MTLYVGDTVAVSTVVLPPFGSVPIIDGISVLVEFYAPGKDPKNVPADRSTPDFSATALYDATAINKDGSLGAFVAYRESVDWPAGRWSFRTTVTGAYSNVEFGSFNIKP